MKHANRRCDSVYSRVGDGSQQLSGPISHSQAQPEQAFFRPKPSLDRAGDEGRDRTQGLDVNDSTVAGNAGKFEGALLEDAKGSRDAKLIALGIDAQITGNDGAVIDSLD